jgi:hypothetical protein
MKYAVQNRFESFGDPCPEYHTTFAAADTAARTFAENLAELFFTRDGDNAVIPYVPKEQRVGSADDVAFSVELADDAGATEEQDGRLPWSELVERIYDQVIEIIEQD